ncbi:MAG: hypothetical protein U0575_04930 [Phycisphaerales bacterium]
MPIANGIRGIRRFFGGGGRGDGLGPDRRRQEPGHGDARSSAIDGGAALAAPLAPALPAHAAADELRAAIVRLTEQIERQQLGATDLAAALEPLPRFGEALSDLRRQGVTIGETLADHTERGRRSAEHSHALLQRVGDSLVGQAEVVANVQQQMDALVRTFGGLGEDLDRLRASLGEIATHAATSASTLATLADRQQRREEELVASLRSWRGWSLAILSVIAVAAVAGVVVAAIAMRAATGR